MLKTDQQQAQNHTWQVDNQPPHPTYGSSGLPSQFYWAVCIAILAAIGLFLFIFDTNYSPGPLRSQNFPPAPGDASTANLLNNQSLMDSPRIWAVGAGVCFTGFLLVLLLRLLAVTRKQQRHNPL